MVSAAELSAAVRTGEISIAEVIASTLDRALELGPRVGAFAHLDPDLIRLPESAAQPDGPVGPLAGVPVPIKDLTQVAGWPFEAGSAAFAGHTADVDDGVVTRFAEAGAVLFGKSATPEFGLPCYTEPEGLPPASTPWDLCRSAGGSSGGAAAAVAAGIVPLAHASDGGGSIRIPAACCGLVGLKPSAGRVSSGPHGVPGIGLATHGVLSRDIGDSALGLDALTQAWPGDLQQVPPGFDLAPLGSFADACRHRPARLRIGVLTRPAIIEASVHPAALRAVERAAALLDAAGHVIVDAPVPFPPERWQTFWALWTVGALGAPVPPEREHLLRPLTRWLREHGRRASGADHAHALAAKQQLTVEVARTWVGLDVVLTPTLAQPPALHGSLRDDADPRRDFDDQCRYTPWTSVANLTGRPSLSLPLHTEEVDGVVLPFGVMLTAAVGDDARLLSLGREIEDVLGGWPAIPAIPAIPEQ